MRIENDEIYTRVSQSEIQRKEAFMVYYKQYINIPLYKKDKSLYTKTIGKVESLLKDISDVNRSILVLCNENLDKEVFLTLFSKKERFTSNRYVNAQKVYDVFWDKCIKDNSRLSDDEVVYSTQDYTEDVLCIYTSEDTYVRGVGPILNSLIDSRYNRMNSRGERLLTWIFYRGTFDSISKDKDLSMVYNYFKSANNDSEFLLIDMNRNKDDIVVSTKVKKSEKGTLGDIY